MVNTAIKKLVTYGIRTNLISEEDKICVTNLLLDALGLDSYEEPKDEYSEVDLESVLGELCNYAVKNGIKLKYNNGLAEGSVNKIKVIKRIMYGRNSFDLLKAKVLLHEQFRCEFN